MDLPINIIMILTVSILVLVFVSAYFLLSSNQNVNLITDSSARYYGCTKLLTGFYDKGIFMDPCCAKPSEITIERYRPAASTTDGNLLDACRILGFGDDETTCANACGCSAEQIYRCGLS